MTLLLFVRVCFGQDCTANFTFPNTPNGNVTATVELKNSDGQNTGSGTITKYNGVAVTLTVSYERVPGNIVNIYRDGVLLCAMVYPALATGGNAVLNDGANGGNGSPGTWTR